MASVASLVGIDGTNPTLNTGRLLITLKPLADRGMSVTDVIQRLQPQLDEVEGIELYMQPIQDLTIENRVSRTQYQFTLEAVDATELDRWTNRMVEKLSQLPDLVDVASDSQNQGLQAFVQVDRTSASRLGCEHCRRR